MPVLKAIQEKRSKSDLRQEILDAARELFVLEGYENVSMRKIAQRIDYSPTTIYLYFQDKADLLDSLCEEAFGKLFDRLQQIPQEGLAPLASLRLGMQAYIEFGLDNPQHYAVTFMKTPPSPSDIERVLHSRSHELGMKAFGLLRKSLQACVDSGDIHPGLDVECAGQTFWAAMHGLVALLISCPHFPWAERDRLIDQFLNLQIAGLRK